jgi:hypothetical protein
VNQHINLDVIMILLFSHLHQFATFFSKHQSQEPPHIRRQLTRQTWKLCQVVYEEPGSSKFNDVNSRHPNSGGSGIMPHTLERDEAGSLYSGISGNMGQETHPRNSAEMPFFLQNLSIFIRTK